MEAELGLALLVRGPRRRVQLTPAGERVLSFARKTLELLDVLGQDLARLKTVGQGTLSLAASTIPGEYVLPALLAGFRAKYPAVEVKMIIAQADGHLACVRLAGVDLHRDLYLAYLSQRLGDPLVARFLGFARSQYAE